MKPVSVLLPLLAATSATAGWFVDDGTYQRQREEKVAVLAPVRVDALRQMIATRDARQAEVVVLHRLADEKTAAIEEADRRFAGEYGIRPDRNYTYDPADLTVYLLSPDPRHGGSPESPVRLAHRVFPTEEEAQAFLDLVREKQAEGEARATFLAAAAEKEAALRDVTARMGFAYGLDPARSYRLDPDLRAIFVQYVPPPPRREKTPEEIAAEKDAKAAAERQAREEARARAEALRAEARRISEERAKLSADQKESIKVRDQALKQLEKELAEAERLEAKLQKQEEERRAEEERLAKKAAEKAARELAEQQEERERAERKAAEKAAREAEKAARELAEQKEERERAERKAAEKAAREQARAEERARREAEKAARELAERKAEEERLAAEKAEKEALEASIRDEEARLARHVEKVKRARAAKRDRMALAFEQAQFAERDAEDRLERARRAYKEGRASGFLSKARLDALRADVERADEALDAARAARKQARRDRDDAADRLDRAEKDAVEAFDDYLRANGRKPLRPSASGGFFSWF